MIKNRFKDDYSRTARLNGRGRVVDDICYTGDYYVLPFNKEQKRKMNLVNMGFSAVLILIQIITGMVNQDSSRTIWIVYPYLIIFLPLAYLLVGAVSFWGYPVRMQKAQYETGPARIRRSLTGAVVLTGISAMLDVVYMILHLREINIIRELFYLLCHGLLLAVGFFYLKYLRRAFGGLAIEPSAYKAE